MLRLPIFRAVAALLPVVAVLSCTDASSRLVKPSPGQSQIARVAFAPVFAADARAAATRLADFGLDFDHVRVVIIRPPSDTVRDTTITFVPGQQDVTLDLTVEVHSTGEAFHAAIDYTNPSGVVFHGEGTVQSHAPDAPAPAQEVTVHYAGPGANVTRIVISPKPTSIAAPSTVPFTVAAFDANNASVPSVPVNWSSSDASVATISNTGLLTTTGKRGTVTVTAVTPTNATDNASLTVTLPTSGIVVVSGAGQTGKVGATLSVPVVVRVVASDGLGVANAGVTFAAPAGGKVSPTTAVTSSTGTATVTLTLGGAIGPQSFAAVAGSFSTSIGATATVGDPSSIAPVSGSSQTDTVLHVLKPLVVKVTDQFANPVPGATVTWSHTRGTGSLGAPTSTTGADGQATVSYTLGSIAGSDTVTASVAGIASPVIFAVQAVAGAPAVVAATSGTGQTARILQLLAPFVIHVADDNGNPVVGATVLWTATNGTLAATTLTDATGTSSNVMTTGTAAGTAVATATVGSKSISFTATVQPGLVANTVIKTGPPASVIAAVPIVPAILVVLQDAGGNLTGAINPITVSLGANPGGGTLTGTLTRTAVAGVATFDDLKIDKAGSGYTLVFSSGSATSATSAAFDVIAGAATQLAIVAGDAQSAIVNAIVATAPAVRVADVAGNPIAGAPVTFAPANGSGSVVPATAVTTNAQGVATLTSWKLGTLVGAQSLGASSPGVPSVTIHATALPGAAAQLIVLTPPTAAPQSGIVFPTQPVIALLDAFGNAAPQGGVPVGVALQSGGGALTGTLVAATNAQGQAAFTNLKIDGIVGQRQLAFTSAGLTSTSATVALIPGTAAKLAYIVQPSNTPAQLQVISPAIVVAVQDVDGNTVTSAANPVSVAITAGSGTPGATLAGGTSASAASGVATFGKLSIATLGTGYSLTASSPGLVSAVSAPFNITAGLIAVTPNAVDAAFTNVALTLTGTDFVPGATTVNITGGVLTIGSFSVQGVGIITGTLNMAATATTTLEQITVNTPFGTSNALPIEVAGVGAATTQLGASNGGGGGTPYTIDCPVGSLATGLNVRGGANVDNVAVICQTITGAARTFGAPTSTAGVGGGGGSPTTLACPANYLMIGLTGRIGSGGSGLNDEIAAVCAPLAGGATVNTASVGSNFSGSIAYTTVCPDGLAVAGLQGGAGNLVDRTQIRCR